MFDNFDIDLKKIDWYIIRTFLTTFFFALLLILCIAIVLDYVDKIDDYAESHASASDIIFKYYKNFIPYFAVLFSSIFVFISVIFFTARLAYRNEIISILSSGTSYYRFLLPYLIGALIIFGMTLYASHYLVPRANEQRHEFEHVYIRSPYQNKDRNIHMQLDETSYMYIERFNATDSVGYKFSLEQFNDLELVYKLRADRIVWDKTQNLWQIRNYQIRTIDGLNETLSFGSRLDTVFNFTPSDFVRKVQYSQNLTTPELIKFIELEKLRGSDVVQEYELEKYKRTAFPFASIILTLMGASIASRKSRGGIGFQLGVGMALGFSYILLQQFSSTFAASGAINPLLGVWIPNILYGVITLFLIYLAPK